MRDKFKKFILFYFSIINSIKTRLFEIKVADNLARNRKKILISLFLAFNVTLAGVIIQFFTAGVPPYVKDYKDSLLTEEYKELIVQNCNESLAKNVNKNSASCAKPSESWKYRVLVNLKDENRNFSLFLKHVSKVFYDKYKSVITHNIMDSENAYFETSSEQDKKNLEELLTAYANTIQAVPDKKISVTAKKRKKKKRFTPKDPYLDRQWALQTSSVPKAWKELINIKNKSVVVAVIDSGVDYAHPELTDIIISGYDFVNKDDIAEDENGHGTAITGIIAAKSNRIGIAGVNPFVKIMPLKVIGADGSGSLIDMLLAIKFAADNGASVVNISAGFKEKLENAGPLMDTVQSYINYALSKGVLIVVSAGNETPAADEIIIPAAAEHVLSVGAVDNSNVPMISDPNYKPGILAPGISILTLNTLNVNNPAIDVFTKNDLFGYISGTSGAAAVVSGVASLLVTEYPGLSPFYYKTILETTSDETRVNAYEAIRTLQESIYRPKDYNFSAKTPDAPSMDATITAQSCAKYELVYSCSSSQYVQCPNFQEWAEICPLPYVTNFNYPGCPQDAPNLDYSFSASINTDRCWRKIIVVDAALLQQAIEEKDLAASLMLLVLYSSNLTDDDLADLIAVIEEIYGLSAAQTDGMDRAQLLETLVTDIVEEMVAEAYPDLTQSEIDLIQESIIAASLYEIQQRDVNLPQTGCCDGNPVRMAGGTKETNAMDLSIPVLSTNFEISRNQSVYYKNNFSFGKSWFFNYDTRIIVGVKKDADRLLNMAKNALVNANQRLTTLQNAKGEVQGHIDEVNGIITTLQNNMGLISALWNEAETIRSNALSHRNTAIAKRNEAVNEADKAIQDAQDSNADGADAVIAEAQQIKNDADTYMNIAKSNYTSIVNRINTASNNVPDSQTLISEIQNIQSRMITKRNRLDSMIATMQGYVDQLTTQVEELQLDADIAAAHRERNKYVIDPDNTSEQDFGNDYIKWIDENGNNHFFLVHEDGTVEPLRKRNYNDINGVQLTRTSTDGYDITTLSGEKYSYDNSGQLISKQDQYGVTLTFSYSNPVQTENGDIRTLKEVTDRFGRTVTFEYSGRNLVSVSDFGGRQLRYFYDENFLTRFTDSMGQVTTLQYDKDNLTLTRIIDRNGGIKQYKYEVINEVPRVVKETDPLGNTRTFDYDFEARISSITDRRGNKTTYYSNEAGSTIQIVYPDLSTKKFEYDANENLIAQIDENGNRQSYTYNDANQIKEVVLPNGAILSFEYNFKGKVKSVKDGLGGLTSFTYTSNGNLLTKTTPDGGTTVRAYNLYGQPIRITDPNGNSVTMIYDQYGYIESKTDGAGGQTTFEFDILGRPIMIIAPDNGETYYDYDKLNRPVSITDPLGAITAFEYLPEGQVVKIARPLNYVQTFTYDAAGNLIRKDEPGNVYLEYEYDEEENVVFHSRNGRTQFEASFDERGRIIQSSRGGSGDTVKYKYDKVGNLTRIINPDDSVYSVAYDNMNQKISLEDTLGNKSLYEYDANGNLVSMIDKEGNRYRYSYDKVNRLKQLTDPLGGTFGVTYDNMGNKTSITDNNGNFTQYSYNKINKLASITDPIGGKTNLFYDSKGRLAKVIQPNGGVTKFQYNANDKLIAITDALNNTSFIEYDILGSPILYKNNMGEIKSVRYDERKRPVEITDPLGNVSKILYDTFDNVIERINQLGNSTTYEYNAHRKVVSQKLPSGAMTTYKYDSMDRLIKKTDSLNQSTYYSYDTEGHLIKVTDALDHETMYQYSPEGNLLSYIDPNKNETKYSYDSLSRLISETDALNNISSFAYDANGNLIKKLLPDGESISYTYDKKNRLIQKADSFGAINLYRYDLSDNLTAIENADYFEKYQYDLMNRLTLVENVTLNKSIRYTYDAQGRRIYMSSPKAPGIGTDYRYDKAGRLVGIHFPETPHRENTISYDAAGKPIQISYINGVVKDIQYDADNNISNIRNSVNGRTFLSFLYERDSEGKPVQITRETGRVDKIAYDELGRMIQFDRGSYSMSYTYDAAGNRIQESGFIPDEHGGAVSVNYEYNALNQLVKRGDTTYQYDRRGNRIAKVSPTGISTYSYNADNLLTGGVNANSTAYQYKYDSLDRRTYKMVSTYETTKPEHSEHTEHDEHGYGTHVMYDGRQTLYEMTDTGAPLTQYGFIPKSPYGELVMRKFYGYKGRDDGSKDKGDHGGKPEEGSNGNTHYYHTDMLGTTWKMTNHQGRLSYSYDYDVWGNLQHDEFSEGSYEYNSKERETRKEEHEYEVYSDNDYTNTINRFLYTGKEYDFVNNTTHMDSRNYEMQSGVWLQKDSYNIATVNLPQSAQGSVSLLNKTQKDITFNPGALNLYTYVNNNPAQYNDPTGHILPWVLRAAGGAFFAGLSEYSSQLIQYGTIQNPNKIYLAMGTGAVTGLIGFNPFVAGGTSSFWTQSWANYFWGENENPWMSGLYGTIYGGYEWGAAARGLSDFFSALFAGTVEAFVEAFRQLSDGSGNSCPPVTVVGYNVDYSNVFNDNDYSYSDYTSVSMYNADLGYSTSVFNDDLLLGPSPDLTYWGPSLQYDPYTNEVYWDYNSMVYLRLYDNGPNQAYTYETYTNPAGLALYSPYMCNGYYCY